MADKTAIEWTDATWNPTTGCTQVSPGCDHCYALTLSERFRGVPGHYFENGFDVQLRPDKLDLPMEPLLGPVELDENWLHGDPECQCDDPAGCHTVDWVIVGGESGRGARPMEADWARSLRDECRHADVAFHFKQWGAHGPDGVRRDKHANGRELDGRTWDEFPEVAS